jgi:hypothetical protein
MRRAVARPPDTSLPGRPYADPKKWLAAQPRTATLAELQAQLDTFTSYYNTRRPHKSLPHRAAPTTTYAARPRAAASVRTSDTHDRVRRDIIDKTGCVTQAGELAKVVRDQLMAYASPHGVIMPGAAWLVTAQAV